MPTTTPTPATPDEMTEMIDQITAMAQAGDPKAAATITEMCAVIERAADDQDRDGNVETARRFLDLSDRIAHSASPAPATPVEVAEMRSQLEEAAAAGDANAAATLAKIRTRTDFPGSSQTVPQYGGDQAWRLELSDGDFGEFERVNGKWWGRLTVDGEVSQWGLVADVVETPAKG